MQMTGFIMNVGQMCHLVLTSRIAALKGKVHFFQLCLKTTVTSHHTAFVLVSLCLLLSVLTVSQVLPVESLICSNVCVKLL